MTEQEITRAGQQWVRFFDSRASELRGLGYPGDTANEIAALITARMIEGAYK